MNNIVNRNTPHNAFRKGSDYFVTILQCRTLQTTKCATILFGDDDIVGNVYKTTSQITSIGGLHSGIGKTLTRTVGRNEVFQHRHTFLEVGKNRVFNDLSPFSTCFLRLCHQTTHTSQLSNLVSRTTGAGVKHHINGIETLVGFGHVLHYGILQVVVDMSPGIDHLIVTLLVGNETHFVVGFHLVNL